MSVVSIIGAGGFIGSRLVESLILDGFTDFRVVMRSNHSLARLCRFGPAMNARMADATDITQLRSALEGSSTVVNLVAGDAKEIIKSTKAIYAACVENEIKRLIHMSSAVVYGHVDSPELNDDSPPVVALKGPYALAKVESEVLLKDAAILGTLEIVVLRPGIVWGPRSPWSCRAAQDLIDGKAYLIGNGEGICNSVYIDNLISSIQTCIGFTGNVSGFFNVSDKELVTWYDFYSSLADYCGYDMQRITRVPGDHFRPSLEIRVEDFKSGPIYQWIKGKIPQETRTVIKTWLNDMKKKKPKPGIKNQASEKPTVTREMWDLQKVKYKLPNSCFMNHFSYHPPVSFKEGVRRTINWLRFAGYGPDL